jgi:hypothetical protein
MWIIKINAIFNLIAFIIGLIKYKYFSRELKFIFYFVAFGVLTEIYSKFHMHFIMKNTMPIGHFYFPLAFLFMGIFYLNVLKGFIQPKFILFLIITFEIYCVINSLFIQSLFDYPSLVGSIGAMLLFLFAVALFTKIMIEAKITKLSAEPIVWINTAILIYYTGNFFYHSLFNLRITASMEMFLFSTKLFSVLNMLFYLTIAVGFIIVKRKQPMIKRKK